MRPVVHGIIKYSLEFSGSTLESKPAKLSDWELIILTGIMNSDSFILKKKTTMDLEFIVILKSLRHIYGH
jgi:hypothetical protein